MLAVGVQQAEKHASQQTASTTNISNTKLTLEKKDTHPNATPASSSYSRSYSYLNPTPAANSQISQKGRDIFY